MDAGITAINDRVREGSAFAYRLREEIGDRHRRPALPGRPAADRPARDGHVLLEGVPGLAKTLSVKTLAAGDRGDLPPHPVHARPAARRPHRHADLQPARRRLHRQARAGLRQPRPRRRDQPRAGQGAERAARGDAGAPGHDRRRDATRCPSRSSCSPRRTRSSRKAPIRCPRRRSTASCSSSASSYPTREEERQILDRMATSGNHRPATPGRDAPTTSSPRARSSTRCTSTTRSRTTSSTSCSRRASRKALRARPRAAHRVRRLAARHDLPDARRARRTRSSRAAATSRRRT